MPYPSLLVRSSVVLLVSSSKSRWQDLTNLFTREIDTHGTLSQKAGIELVLVPRNTGDDNVAERRSILYSPPFKINNLMCPLLNTLPTSKLLDTGDVDTVHAGAVVGQQRRKRSSDDLRAIHHANSMPEETVPVRQYRVVDIQVF